MSLITECVFISLYLWPLLPLLIVVMADLGRFDYWGDFPYHYPIKLPFSGAVMQYKSFACTHIVNYLIYELDLGSIEFM